MLVAAHSCCWCDFVWAVFLQHASPGRGQDSGTDGGGEGHPSGRGATERDGVALICRAALKFSLIGDTEQDGRGGHVAAGGVIFAALGVEAWEAWERWESWGEMVVLDS